MECSKCNFQNPEGTNFCGECGQKLELECPKCSCLNPPNFKFCGKCGQNITPSSNSIPIILSMDDQLEKIQRYLPKDFTEKNIAKNDKIEGERKQVTIMFCDMEGFTPLVEKFGSEQAYSLMDRVYKVLIHKVHDYEGTVNEMTGDGIMALFGAPMALEDAPQRAIRSSIKIHREIAKLSEKLKNGNKDIPILRMRIGINSGPVVVGVLGNGLKTEFKVVGDTVNIASRLEKLAEPGTTYVSEKTFKLTKGMFLFESLGELVIKGKTKTEKAYRLISSSNIRTRFDVSAEHGLTPLVGREKEVDFLVDGFERIKSSDGQVFSIVSEAGIGKSRLLYEFRKAIANEDVVLLVGRCLSYSKGVPYHLIIDLLKSNVNIQGKNDHEIREKIQRSLNNLGIDENLIIPYFLELLSVKESGIKSLIMSPNVMKHKIAESLKLIIQKLSEIKPLIVTIEDLHWADETSIEIINFLFKVVSGSRVLFVITYRPEFIPNWGDIVNHCQVTLYRLTTKQSNTMVGSILEPSHSNDELTNFVVAKTEGIPFFIEEFIKYLKTHRLIEKKENLYFFNKKLQEIKVPSTIQDLIMARVDRVPNKAKKILKIGSAIEREFSYELISHLVHYSEPELLSILSILKESELVFIDGVFPKSVFVFKHALIKEIIYESILSDKKKQYHGQIGLVIEKLAKDKLPEHYEILARHFILGANYEKGAEYSRLSCRKMLKTASLYDAVKHVIKRIECLERLQMDDEVEKQIIEARILLGLLYIQKNLHVPAMETIQPILAIAEKTAEKRRLSQLYTIVGSYQSMVGEDFPGALKSFQKALKLAKEADDISSGLQAKYWLGLGQALHCNFKEAEQNFNTVLEAYQASNLWGVSALKSVISYSVYYYKGNIEKGYYTSLDAIGIAEENRDIYSITLAHVAHGILCYCKGFIDKALKHLTKGVELCESSSLFSWNGLAQICLGDIYYEAGLYEKSVDHFNKQISLTLKWGSGPSWYNIGLIGTIRAKTAMGDHDINLAILTRSLSEIKFASMEGRKSRFLSEIFFNMGKNYLGNAEDLIQKAIQADIKNSMLFSLGKDYQVYAHQIIKSGNLVKAKFHYKNAIDVFQRCKADNWVEKIQKKMELI